VRELSSILFFVVDIQYLQQLYKAIKALHGRTLGWGVVWQVWG